MKCRCHEVNHRRVCHRIAFSLDASVSRAQENANSPELADESDAPLVFQPAGPPPTPVHTGFKAMIKKGIGRDFVQLPSKENLYWALGGGAGALAAHHGDQYVYDHIGGNPTADAFFKPGRVIGLVVPIGGSVATYAWGRLRDEPRVSHVGTDLIQSQVIAQALTMALKYTTRRERPDQSSLDSFPSGHAASYFCVRDGTGASPGMEVRRAGLCGRIVRGGVAAAVEPPLVQRRRVRRHRRGSSPGAR